jgi:ribosomal-protein-alanine N-acetyltransferase
LISVCHILTMQKAIINLDDAWVMREATMEDLRFLERIERECFAGERFDRRTLCSFLEDRHVIMMVAEFGSFALEVRGERARLLSIAVLPEARGRGHGKEMMREAIAVAKAKGARVMELEVNMLNVEAINLYLKHGLSIAGMIADYYGPGKDAFYMTKRLAPGRD